MSNLLIINNVRGYIDENGTAQLNLEDVARGLGFTQTQRSGNDTVRWDRVKEYLESFGTPTSGSGILPDFIPENIFFRLAMKAKNETAEKFQTIVCDEILPQIRKTGSYQAPQFNLPTTYADALRQLATTVEEKEKLVQQNLIMLPKAEFFDAVADSKDAIQMNDAAKVLGIKGMGRNNLFEFLREQKVLMNNNRPYQKYTDVGYFRVIEQKYMKQGEEHITFKTLVYQKGLNFISKLLTKRSSLTTV